VIDPGAAATTDAIAFSAVTPVTVELMRAKSVGLSMLSPFLEKIMCLL
jgi:hypothetical protein